MGRNGNRVGYPRSRGGFVYLIRSGEHVKIGVAANVARRLTNLQTAHVSPLVVLGAIEFGDPLDAEKQAHERFAAQRVRGEWFAMTDGETKEALAFLSELAGPVNEPVAEPLPSLWSRLKSVPEWVKINRYTSRNLLYLRYVWWRDPANKALGRDVAYIAPLNPKRTTNSVSPMLMAQYVSQSKDRVGRPTNAN